MTLDDFITANAKLILEHPSVFISFGLLVAGASIAATRAFLGSGLEAARERTAAAHEEVTRLREARDQLAGRVAGLEEALGGVREEIRNLPKIIVSETPPEQTMAHIPDGSLWIVPDRPVEAAASLTTGGVSQRLPSGAPQAGGVVQAPEQSTRPR